MFKETSPPYAGSKAVLTTSLSPRAAAYLNKFGVRMLAEEGPAAMASSSIVAFAVLARRSRRPRVELVGLLWTVVLLTEVKSVRGRTHPFTVVEEFRGDGSSNVRFVLTQRLDNLAWEAPPWTSMASPGLFPFVQVPREPGKEDQVMVGDLPDMCWILALPTAMAEHCGPDGFTLND